MTVDLNKAVTDLINEILAGKTDLPAGNTKALEAVADLEGRVSDLECYDLDDMKCDLDRAKDDIETLESDLDDKISDAISDIDWDDHIDIGGQIDDKLHEFGAVGDDDVREIVRDEMAKAFRRLSEVLNNG